MKPIKVLGVQERAIDVKVWPLKFLTAWKESMFGGEGIFLQGNTLWNETRMSPAHKVRDLTDEEVQVLYHLDSLIKYAYNSQQGG